jgi:hypothetical protein
MSISKVTEDTLVPIGLVLAFMGAIVYVTFAMAKVDNLILNDTKQDAKIDGQTVLLLDIRDRLIRLEEKRR